MRKALYPSFVRRGKMSKESADEEIAVLEEIRSDYAYISQGLVES